MTRRRRRTGAAVAVAVGIAGPGLSGPRTAGADDGVRVDVEGGGEVDSNVRRIERGPDDTDDPVVAAALIRLAGRLAWAGRRGRQQWGLTGATNLRAVADGSVAGEDVAVVSADGRWDRALSGRPALLGLRASYYDALALGDVGGARTFSSLAGLAVVSAIDDGRVIQAWAGGRRFRYKPDDDFDWTGPVLGARVSATLWRDDGDDGDAGDPVGDDGDAGAAAGDDGAGPRSSVDGGPAWRSGAAAASVDQASALDVGVSYLLEHRGYQGLAFRDGCGLDAMVEPTCFVPSGERRTDVHHVIGVDATWTGERVYGASYELVVNDSTSFGQSLVRQRLTLAATVELPARVYATATVVGQLDLYLDPLLLARDVQSQAFTTVDDENRSELALRLARPLTERWSLEARYAFFGDAWSSDPLRFRRHTGYVGVTWSRD